MPTIHPSAVVDKDAELHDTVEIGPGCVISGKVRLDRGVRLIANVCIHGPASVGADTVLYPGVCLGFPPQDVKFKLGDRTAGVIIGTSCILRENVTVHAATSEQNPTAVGDRCFMMVNTHLGHDARIGTGVVMVNNSALGGHAHVADNATLGGGALLHQFARVGRNAFISGFSGITCDVPPFCIAYGRNHLAGLNLVGLRRAGVPRDQITLLREAYRKTIRAGISRADMVTILRGMADRCPAAAELADFIATGKRALSRHHNPRHAAADPDEPALA